MQTNVLYVVQGHDHPALLRSSLTAIDLSWISGKPPHQDWVYAAKSAIGKPMHLAQLPASSTIPAGLALPLHNGVSRPDNP